MDSRKIIAGVVLFFSSCSAYCAAQPEDSSWITDVGRRLEALVAEYPVFAEEVDISVGNMQLSELLRMVAKMKDVNLSVRGGLDFTVSCSFTRSRIDRLLLFLPFC